MKKLFVITLMLAVSATTFSQNNDDMMKEFEKFRSQIYSNYHNYLSEINAEYERFMREAWKGFEAEAPIPKPEPVPEPEPVVMDDPAPVIEDNKIEVQPVVMPAPEPAPKPIINANQLPDNPNPAPLTPISVPTVTVNFYGAAIEVKYDKEKAPRLSGTKEDNVADYWHELCDGCCNSLLKELFDQRTKRDLSDWAYYELCRKTAESLSSDRNEKEVLTAFVLSQSGFKVKMGRDTNGILHTLVAVNSAIYERPYWVVDETRYYLMNDYKSAGQMYIMQSKFPEEKAMRLEMTAANRFDLNATNDRELVSERYPDIIAVVRSNKNLIDFYNTYPTSVCNDDPMTRWWFYAMSPMDDESRKTLYPALKGSLEGISEKEKVERLLNFVQTAFAYEFDDKVWGCDRAFFAEETLYYPYCDCEDRSILFSRLVRDLVGLDVALVLYPGHLATAVAFSSDVTGDYMVIKGRRFTVCDPTFINAPVGMTMKGMDNSSAKVIVLKGRFYKL